MANPQCENGYTKIANELLEAACRKLTNATWLRIFFFTVRITYGWRRKEAQSNYNAYATKLNLLKDTIKTNLLDMHDRKIITFVALTPNSFVIAVNKNYESWKVG